MFGLNTLFEGLEIEERRPRTFNEPRRKRLRFVRGGTREPEEWRQQSSTLQRRPTQQEAWHHRQREAAGRFMHQERMREEERIRAEEHLWRLRNPVPHPPLQGPGGDSRMIPIPPDHGGGGHPGGHGGPHGGGHPHDIEEVSSESGDSEYDRPVKVKLIKPPKKQKLPKEYHRQRSKSRGRKDRNDRRYASSSSSDSSDDDRRLGRMVKAGLRGASRARSRTPARRGRTRSRSRSRHFYNLPDDSWESLHRYPLRNKSRHGGRYY